MAKLSDQGATETELSSHNPPITDTSDENPTTGDAKLKRPDHGPLKRKFEDMAQPSHDNDPTDDAHSETDPTDGAHSETDPTDGAHSETEIVYDFAFVMKPVKVLTDALKALSDIRFNPSQNAVIQVRQNFCMITVSTFDINIKGWGYGYLGLKATDLEEFQCREWFKKSFSLKHFAEIHELTEESKNDSVFVYSVQGSKYLSFDWGSKGLDLGIGTPVLRSRIGLTDVDPRIKPFPAMRAIKSTDLVAVIRSSDLRMISMKLREQAQLVPHPKTAEVTVKAGTIEIGAGNVVRTLGSSVEDKTTEHQISTAWGYWEFMESAASLTDTASFFLVKNSPTMIVRFRLKELADLVYLIPVVSRS